MKALEKKTLTSKLALPNTNTTKVSQHPPKTLHPHTWLPDVATWLPSLSLLVVPMQWPTNPRSLPAVKHLEKTIQKNMGPNTLGSGL